MAFSRAFPPGVVLRLGAKIDRRCIGHRAMNDPETQVIAIFAEAIEIADPAERAAFLDRACGSDEGLRQEVEELLKAQARAGLFLPDQPQSLPRGHPSMDFLGIASIPRTEKIGDRIGRYQLLQKIGEGGCGIVYMAEQERPVHRKVAIKVIKLGMDTRSVVARFRAERQALALMDHPGIATVLDAGATETGRPYFVMELVRGEKITAYCDEHHLTVRDRLRLFLQVCEAIQHAHQKGIIHRDIKPANILVTLSNGVAAPKVIDFGIAKATQGRLTDQTLFTAFEQFIGTPAYMSPEQAVMTSVDIDTRSDIYSLGVLLYELLTGSTPFDQKALLSSGLDEMRRTIRDVEPPMPSTRLSGLSAEKLHAVAIGRQIEPLRLIRLLRGDLKWIVMKCLEKDRAHRYDTTNGLAADVRRYLEDEPIMARPHGKLYRFQKLVRRNKLLCATCAAVGTALVTGLAVSMWLLHKETAARREAVMAEAQAWTEMQKSMQSVAFLRELLLRLRPIIAENGDTTELKKALEGLAWQVQPDLVNRPDLQQNLFSIIALLYLDFGQDQEAEKMARQGVETLRKGARQGRRLSAEPLRVLRDVLLDEHKFVEARELFNGSLPMEVGLQPGSAQFLRIRGDLWARTGEWQAARADFAELVRLEPDDHEGPYSLAPLLVQTEDPVAYRRFRGQVLARFGSTTNDSSMAHRIGRICLILPAEGRELEAAGTLADLSVALGEGRINEPWCLFTKGLADYRRGRYGEAVDSMHKVQALTPVQGQGRMRHLGVQSYAVLAMAESQLKHPQEAHAALAAAAKIMQEEMELSAKTGSGRGQPRAGVALMQKERHKPEGVEMTNGWREWLIAYALFKEAQVLVQP